MKPFCALALCTLAAAQQPRPKFFPVKPVAPTGANLTIASGQFFSYALPQGWRVGEDGQFALTLIAPDNHAFTVMVGNAGLPPNYPPAQFVSTKLMAMRPNNLRLGEPRPAKPVPGFTQAVEFDIAYSTANGPVRGIAKCNIQPAYDSTLMAMTAAISQAGQWEGYAKWLPQVADQISAVNGAAFGVRGLMAQNLRNSTAYAEAARNYREWSQRNWQQVTDDRNASQDRRNTAVRENLGGVQPYLNPFGDNQKVDLPLTYRHYWMDRQGNIVGTDDPSANPNQGATTEWRPMKRPQ
ncbi:MAG: hypothetical protein JWP63_3437 [Candidatus Solibacter sp.]|nr:hypothetical protein [Candidatus Solibacter sp.]